jgi:excisionase family DNA binding protein
VAPSSRRPVAGRKLAEGATGRRGHAVSVAVSGGELRQLTDVSKRKLHQDLQRNHLQPSFHLPGRAVLMTTPSTLSDVKFLTVYEVAVILRLSKMSVYRLVHSGELEAVRVGRSFRVPEQAIVSYLQGAGYTPAGRQAGETAMRDTWT